MKNLYFMFLLLLGMNGFAQKQLPPEPCGTDQLMDTLLKENPGLRSRIDAMNQKIRDKKSSNFYNRDGLTEPAPIIIPVVVYVVHDGTALINISDSQVQSQITALNDSFNAYGIKFCLATKTANTATLEMPSGAIQDVPGIIHVNSPVSTDHTMTGLSQQSLINNTVGSGISSDKYLRIWVVKSINTTASGIVGYGVFPDASPILDGIVMRYDVFGDIGNCAGCNLLPSNNQGKVLVHEVGHYLNLYHTFQGGCSGDDSLSCDASGDEVCDTPQVNAYNSGCPLGADSCGGLPDDINNYMDYTNDVCRVHFTPGQIERMIESLNLFRAELFSNDNLINAGVCDSENLISASFTPDTYQPCSSSSVPVVFTPLVVSAPNTAYLWDFGDPASGSGNTSTSSTITSHLFTTAAGSPYTVTLTLTKDGQSMTYATQIFVTDCSPIQNTASNWYLSTSNGLKFGTGVPVYDDSLPLSHLFKRSCAVQNDDAGNVQFYTNGVSVWDSNYTLVNTTIPLKGSPSTRDGVISVPIPGTTDFYIFTKSYNTFDGFRKSRINVAGSVCTMPTATINQPILQLAGMSGFLTGNNSAVYGGTAIAAIQSCNGYWIFTTLRKSSGLFITVFSLTSTGLSYVSSIALPALPFPSQEEMHISKDGNKLVYINTTQSVGKCYLFDFDKFSGTLSNQTIILDALSPVAGVEFSPNSNFVYISDLSNAFYQININSAIPSLNKRILTTNIFPRGSKRGPDNKIYFINTKPSGNYRMGVIHNPDELATESNPNACNFSPNGPLMERELNSGSGTDFVLPNIVEKGSVNSISAYAVACNSYKFFPNVSQASCYASFNWDFGDPDSGTNNAATSNTPTHVFSDPGTYTVTLYSPANVFIADVTVTIADIPTVEIFGSSSACLTGNIITNHSVNLLEGQTVTWSVMGGSGTIAGANDQSGIDISWSTLPGTVSATITDIAGCSTTTTATIVEDCTIESADCPGSLTFNTTEAYTSADYQVSGDIFAGTNYLVNPGSTIVMTAGNSITFDPASEIKFGSDFEAFIADCTFSKAADLKVNEVIQPELEREAGITIYPNPTRGLVTIHTAGIKINSLILSSIEGKIMCSNANIDTASYELNFSDYQNGIYIVTIQTADGNITSHKIIKN